jgi:hypothetical protein
MKVVSAAICCGEKFFLGNISMYALIICSK